MKVFGYLFVARSSTAAANAGWPHKAKPKNRAPSASSKTMHGGRVTRPGPQERRSGRHRAKRRGKGPGWQGQFEYKWHGNGDTALSRE
jgi:hypothetical protein